MNTLEIARRLIGIHSVSNVSSREIADFISNLLEPSGFRIDQHVYRTNGVEKVNVIAIKGDGLPAIALAGHLDTVPFKESEWRSNPLALVERDNKFYGRGACDMKGFIALAMAAGMRIPASNLTRSFALVFTSDEEVGCVGARKLVDARGCIAENIVIGEPTGFRPVNLHKGYLYLKIVLTGKGGHSSQPSKGRNVIARALPTVLDRLNTFEQALQQTVDIRFDPSYATLNLGTINTGRNAAKNIIAEQCSMELDIRPIPGQDVDEIIDSLRRHIAPEGEINGITVEVKKLRTPSLPFETKPEEEIVKAVAAMCGHGPETTSFNTEGGVFNRAGSASVICGLGSIDQAHQPNEFVEARYFKDDILDSYERLVRKFCMVPQGEHHEH